MHIKQLAFIPAIAVSSVALTLAPLVQAAPATDLECAGCVQTSDIANGAVTGAKIKGGHVWTYHLKPQVVTTDKIKDAAVTRAKLAGSAVDYSKLAPGLKSDIQAAKASTRTFDKDTYFGTPVSKKVWKLAGTGFGLCPPDGSTTPDTEVSTFQRNNLGNGVTEIVETSRRLHGGANGTLCSKYVMTYVNDGTSLKMVRIRGYNPVDNSLQYDFKTDYNRAARTGNGVDLATNAMPVGINIGSYGEVTGTTYGGGSSSPFSDGVYINNAVLTDANVPFTINAGTAQEHTYTNCIEIHEDRSSNGFGRFTQVRVACAGAGTVYKVRMNKDSSNSTRIYRLTSVTTN